MATRNIDLMNDIVLKEDIYKDNTLLVKKGNVLNSYLINKLNKFGVSGIANSYHSDFSLGTEILILQSDLYQQKRTKEILKFAGFEQDKILLLDDENLLKDKLRIKSLKYLFIDYSFYGKDLLDEIFLNSINRKLVIFVLNCPEGTAERIYNSDYQNVKLLYRPLANSYIKALLRLYS